MSNSELLEFKDTRLDALLLRWISGDLNHAEQQEWEIALSSNSAFREEFCDWIKSLRDPHLVDPDKNRAPV